jgi:hypothetical protein
MQTKHLHLAVILLCILCIPLIATQFSTEVNWTVLDFVTAAVFLFGTGLLSLKLYSKSRTSKYYLILFILVLLAFILVWVEMAVGIFDSPISGS